ncbi:MAG: response regulator [Acholeplasmataceae bacterium]|nr:response regulator [Acholeplasmataceae bacterium]
MSKILVVEDNRLSRMIITEQLKDMHLEYFEAENGKEALQLWKTHYPEIVITDLTMPEMDGDSLINEIRKRETTQYTYIIVLTSNEEETYLKKSFDTGADDYLVKPLKGSELIYRLKAAERVIEYTEKKSIIYALAQLTDARDHDTGKHIDRIGEYVVCIAKHLQNNNKYKELITTQFISQLELSSALHDIGKVGISDALLKSKDKYTDKQKKEMEQHTIIGAKIIENIQQKYPQIIFLKMAKEIAQSHHEKFDGSGYPNKLQGEQIPLASRIVALADVFDALVSERPYKSKFSFSKAKDIILELSGSHFDPIIVNAFIENQDKFQEIMTRFD